MVPATRRAGLATPSRCAHEILRWALWLHRRSRTRCRIVYRYIRENRREKAGVLIDFGYAQVVSGWKLDILSERKRTESEDDRQSHSCSICGRGRRVAQCKGYETGYKDCLLWSNDNGAAVSPKRRCLPCTLVRTRVMAGNECARDMHEWCDDAGSAVRRKAKNSTKGYIEVQPPSHHVSS